MRFAVASLAASPTKAVVSEAAFSGDSKEWTQPSDLWSALYYHHGNALTVNTVTFAVECGDVALIPPGARVVHSMVGDGTFHTAVRFNLPGSGFPRRAVPYLSSGMASTWGDWRDAIDKSDKSPLAAVAFVWHLVWKVSCDLDVIPGHEAISASETWILDNLHRKFTVQELCEAVEVSQRQLLRLFQAEHGTSVQEYVLQRRIQESTRLLMNTALSVKQVAARVGFNDLQHFNKVMREATGSSPRRFKEISHRPKHG
ncbi:MAG: helix-turn-helix transcriptional regulator [Armatimonadetes bacterium]|nr:helix-turn-helix transcriptional regulator [Armatimonadota bacterium]